MSHKQRSPFLHLCLVLGLNEWDRFSTVDLVLFDVVAREVSHGLHGVYLPIDLDLVTFHRLLDGGTDIADSDVNSSILSVVSCVRVISSGEDSPLTYLDAGIRGVLDGSEQVVIGRIE